MKILIEGYGYDPEVVKSALPENRLFLTNKKVPIEYVGYYHNARSSAAANDDFVFFLPKVVLNRKDRVFASAEDAEDGFSPEEIIDPDKIGANGGKQLTQEQSDFLYHFSVWIYRALAYYLETHPDTEAVWCSHDTQSGAFKRKYVANTFLDVILALIRFGRDNQDYFLFKVKEKHAGLNKINWTRTITRSQALISDGTPVYLNPVNKKRMIDFDEELLVIFYSILNHLKEKYKFRVTSGIGYELITGVKFERYLSGYGIARLKAIKYKYFSDRDLQLWELCHAFFSNAHQANISTSGENYVLAKNFEIVFEAMVDELLGDPKIAEYKNLPDGKEIDHLYVDRSLTHPDDWPTICIADSKYYKLGNALEPKSVSKQFTYARDMLQLNMDLFLYGTEPKDEYGKDILTDSMLRRQKVFSGADVGLLRDEVTEGYDIIPNFFISATMSEDLSYDKDGLSHRMHDEGRDYRSIHFENRLFDRDTLILSHFNVNFLFLVKLYVQNDTAARAKWKKSARDLFMREIRSMIGGRYDLYAIMPHKGVDAQQFFRENFKEVSGRVYSPYPTPKNDESPIYALALQNPDRIKDDKRLNKDGQDVLVTRMRHEAESVRELIGQYFYIEKTGFGENPRQKIEAQAAAKPVSHAPAADVESGVQVVSHVSGPLLKAVVESSWCPCPAAQCKDVESVKVLVLPHTQGANLFKVVSAVAVKKNLGEQEISAEFGQKFCEVVFPSYPVHFWRVERIA